MQLHFSEIGEIIGGTYVLSGDDTIVQSLSIDSRKAFPSPGTLFFAIKGERNDGHLYLRFLYEVGIRQFVVEQPPTGLNDFAGANIIQVSSSIDALQRLAAFHRESFKLPILGITGSNGKTIIKEWLYQMLSVDRVVVKNPGSYNSQVGVPLSVWQLQSHHQLGIFEAGISRPGEMEKLEKVIRPTLGLFTNIGSAHNEGFENQSEKILEKLKLFLHSDVIIYRRDHELLHEVIAASGLPTISWGTNPAATIQVKLHPLACEIVYQGKEYSYRLPFSDKASQENCVHCIVFMLYLGYGANHIQDRILSLRTVPMRMELKEGINQCQVVDDTYNNDLGGLEIALQFLANQHQKKKKRLILSDILESGLDDKSLIEKIVALIEQYALHSFVGIGAVLHMYQAHFQIPATYYRTTQDFLDQFDFDTLDQEVILVKGARTFAFERIVSRIQRKVHGTVMEIDLDALIYNLNFFKSRLKPTTKIMVMVKAFAYGSGSTEIANLLQYHKADYLGVAYADEGVELRKNNITLPIMVMNPSEESFESITSFGLEPEVYSIRIFDALLQYLQSKPCRIHLKLDTGMHRLGFETDALDAVIERIKTSPSIQVASIFSHLAGADEQHHDDFSSSQFEKFVTNADRISSAIGYKPLYHLLNSPGILRLPEFQLDMVRLGIGLYGVDPTTENLASLKPVATLKTIISQVKRIRKGDTIGYGRRGLATRDLVIATLAIGYADGFSRAFSRGVGGVLIQGQVAPVIGNVCMDMTMVDITDIPANEGDEAIVFGKEFPITNLASRIGTIAYEILTSTSERVKRVFVAGSI